MKSRIAITGMGCISGLGRGIDQSWQRLRDGEGAIRMTDFRAPSGEGEAVLTLPAASIGDADLQAAQAYAKRARQGRLDPLSLYALDAAGQAIEAAGLEGSTLLTARTAVLLGCGSSGNATIDASYERLYGKGNARVHPQTIPSSMISAPASQISMMFGITGPVMVTASACASSAHAIGEAIWMLRSGRVDAAVAGGSEACLNLGSMVAWNSLGVVASDTCRPFSAGREGLALGEGAAVCVLEREEDARGRGADILGVLTGYGASSDAAHITAPDQGGIEAAIRAALADSGADPSDGFLISSHGTGTALNDAVEAGALRAVLGDALDASTVIATKSAHGHLIGAGGAIELLLGMRAMAEGVAPPILNFREADPECALPLALEPRPIGHRALLSNSFAFGGLNAVLVGERAA